MTIPANNTYYNLISKQIVDFHKAEVNANNVVGANTTGFERNLVVERSIPVNDANRKNGHNIQFAFDYATIRDTSFAGVKQTNNALDFAISANNSKDGAYYFGVVMPNEKIYYTKDGNFTINQDGILSKNVNGSLLPVSSADGGTIEFQPNDELVIVEQNGNIIINGENRGRLGVFFLEQNAIQNMEQTSGNLISARQDLTAAEEGFSILQGYLANSNQNAIEGVVNMMDDYRSISYNSTFISNIHEMERSSIRTIANSGN